MIPGIWGKKKGEEERGERETARERERERERGESPPPLHRPVSVPVGRYDALVACGRSASLAKEGEEVGALFRPPHRVLRRPVLARESMLNPSNHGSRRQWPTHRLGNGRGMDIGQWREMGAGWVGIG